MTMTSAAILINEKLCYLSRQLHNSHRLTMAAVAFLKTNHLTGASFLTRILTVRIAAAIQNRPSLCMAQRGSFMRFFVFFFLLGR